MTELLIGIDLGASNVRAGVFTHAGGLLASDETTIEARRGPQAGLERIAALVEQVRLAADPGRAARLGGIGVGATGPTDHRRGLILNPGTLPTWINVPIAEFLSHRFDAPACLENDADAAALGEYWQGAARGVSRLYAVTVGTGIGTACILDGQVYRGAEGFHPEGGHLIVDPSGPECYCGGRGCWESWASGTAIARSAREALQAGAESLLVQKSGSRPDRVTAKLVSEAARGGDPLAGSIIASAAERFAIGIYSLVMLFHPEMIVLSGGVMRSSDLFMPYIEAAVRAAGRSVPVEQIRIMPARLGYYAGIYGAAYAALMNQSAP